METAMPSKKNSGSVENSGNKNTITNVNQTTNIDNSKRSYRLMIYIPLALAVSATFLWKIGFIKLPSLSQTEAQTTRITNQSDSTSKKTMPSETSNLKIVLPENESAVPQKIEVKGVLNEMSTQKNLWIYVYAPGEQRYYPHQVKDINKQAKQWSISSISIGNINPDQKGNKWRIGAFVVGEAESTSLMKAAKQSINGVAKLPVEADSTQEISVTRIPGS